MKAALSAGLVLAVLAVACAAVPASAQIQLGGMNLEGYGEVGGRFFINEPSQNRKAKLEEYRDIPQGLFLERLGLRLSRPDESYAVEFGGSKWGQQDQEFALRTGRLGLWQFGFDWDETPHIFSTNARLLATQPSPGVFILPTPRPNLNLYNLAPRLDEVSSRWDTARIFLQFTPTPDLDLKAEYTRIRKSGERPIAIPFSSPGGNFMEVLEPIDQTIHDFRLRGAYSREQWQIQAGYALSVFQNGVSGLLVDNPCFGLPAANTAAIPGCGSDATGAQSRGQLSLAPSNMAHTFTLSGGVNLPMRTRITANASYSLRFQNDDFLPHTINPAITSPLLALPKTSLEGMSGVMLFNLNATTRPLPPLTLSFKYRFFKIHDYTDEITFPAHVDSDRAATGAGTSGGAVVENLLAGRWDYTKHNADLNARWRFGPMVAATVGAGWERWDRNEHREVPTSDELFLKAALDLNLLEWLGARVTYRPSFRRINEYDTFAHLGHSVIEELTTPEFNQFQSVLLRKFDEGARNRQRIDVLLDMTPTDAFTVTLSGGWRWDDYIDSALGLQKEVSWTAGIDLNWMPIERFTVFGGYVHESITQQQRGRYRPVTGTTTFDFLDFDWVTHNVDTVETAHVGFDLAVIPGTLDWRTAAAFSHAKGSMDTTNPLRPTSTGAGAAAIVSATAKYTPDFKDTLFRLDTALRYHFAKNWTASLSYALETFSQSDFRNDGLNPFVPGLSSIWLGTDLQSYTAHIVALRLGYRFK